MGIQNLLRKNLPTPAVQNKRTIQVQILANTILDFNALNIKFSQAFSS